MAADILESFGSLQHKLEQAKSSLKGVDENIKKLIGRDPSDLPPRQNLKRPIAHDEKMRTNSKVVRRNYENEDNSTKRRNSNNVSVFKRLSDKPIYDDLAKTNSKQIISKVIVTPKEIPSRQEALAAQNRDVKSKERNRRMFGALLGTLQKFQQEETKLKKREEKREKIEKKIEEHEIKEKEEIKKERQELFLNRRKKQAEIKMIELKMLRMKEYAAWEERQKPRKNFLLTKAKPHIHYLPRKLNETTKELLEISKKEVDSLIEKRKQAVLEELTHIEERMKKNFENKLTLSDSNTTTNNNEEHDIPQDDHQPIEEGNVHAEQIVNDEPSAEQMNLADNTQSDENIVEGNDTVTGNNNSSVCSLGTEVCVSVNVSENSQTLDELKEGSEESQVCYEENLNASQNCTQDKPDENEADHNEVTNI